MDLWKPDVDINYNDIGIIYFRSSESFFSLVFPTVFWMNPDTVSQIPEPDNGCIR